MTIDDLVWIAVGAALGSLAAEAIAFYFFE
jgi:hypothetical protein